MRLIIRLKWMFWSWTLLLVMGLGMSVFSRVHESTHDVWWGLFWGGVTIFIVVVSHVASRNHILVDDHIKVVQD